MNIAFQKYHGTGNDFIMIDNRTQFFPHQNREQLIQQLCQIKFGVGADGLILLENSTSEDFKMLYFNSDGRESSMCGNGGRCIVAFAHSLRLFSEKCSFEAIDGRHEAWYYSSKKIALRMIDVALVESPEASVCVLNTGSPHYVTFRHNNIQSLDVREEGKKIRYSKPYSKEGINVNFVSLENNKELFVRTYERGVEDETYSCGTGVVASAIAAFNLYGLSTPIRVSTLGGYLELSFNHSNQIFSNIILTGPATKVFEGIYFF